MSHAEGLLAAIEKAERERRDREERERYLDNLPNQRLAEMLRRADATLRASETLCVLSTAKVNHPTTRKRDEPSAG